MIDAPPTGDELGRMLSRLLRSLATVIDAGDGPALVELLDVDGGLDDYAPGGVTFNRLAEDNASAGRCVCGARRGSENHLGPHPDGNSA